MAENETKPFTNSGNNGNIRDWSISTIISFLKSSFRPNDFALVEAELLVRQNKSRLEIEALKEENRSLSNKFEEDRLEKVGLVDELRKCNKAAEEMRSELSRLKVENMVLERKGKSAEERCNRLSEELKIMRDKDHEIIDLKAKNCDLECAKAKAESDMEILRVRFQELDKRVLSLENGLTMLGDNDSKNHSGIGGEIRNSENGSVKPAESNGHSPNAGIGGLPSQNIVEIIDLDSDDDSAQVGNPSEKRMTSPTHNSHSAQLCVENETPDLKRKHASSMGAYESENGEIDDTTLSGKLKTRKLQEPFCRPDDCPINQCSTTIIPSDINGVNKAQQREDFMVSGQHEQQIESEQNSRDLMNVGFPLEGLCLSDGSSDSSDSESDDDSVEVHIFNPSRLAAEAQRENRN